MRLSSRWALFGGLAIFLYVGAEVAIGTQMAFFLHSDSIWGRSDAPFAFPLIGHIMGSDGIFGVSAEEAGKAVALYWGGAMVGRRSDRRCWPGCARRSCSRSSPPLACLMCLYVFAVGGVAAGFVALCIGLFNSIMFPVIFTLTLERSTASDEATSGFLCFSIVGGALIPPLVGLVSQHTSYVKAFIVPAACYAVLFLFSIAANRARVHAQRRAGGGDDPLGPAVRHPLAEEADRSRDDSARFEPADVVAAAILRAELGFDDHRIERFDPRARRSQMVDPQGRALLISERLPIDYAQILRLHRVDAARRRTGGNAVAELARQSPHVTGRTRRLSATGDGQGRGGDEDD